MILPVIFFSCRQDSIEIYISPGGSDSGAGTKENPVRTVEKANELAAEAFGKKRINIIFEDGIHYLPETIIIKPDNSGTSKYPVTYMAANEGKAVISGGKKLNLEWESYKNGIYKAGIQVDVSIDQLYINGERQRMARFPNAVEGKNVFDTWDLIHTREPDPDNDPLSEKRVDSWNNPAGAYIHAMHTALWGDMHWVVKGKKADGSLDIEGGWQNNRPSPMHPRYRIIENVFEELDAPGEWYNKKDEGTLYYYPHKGTDLADATLEIVRLKHLAELKGTREDPVRFVTLKGFVFRHAARSFMENREQLLRSDWTTYRGGAVFINGAEDCSVLDCEFDQSGGNSIFINNYNRRITIKSCYIHHSGANGIAFTGDSFTVRSPLFRYGPQDFENMDHAPGPKGDNYPSDCLVEDCLIRMTGRYEKQTAPVQISMSHKITVRHCSIFDVPRAGINISVGTFGGHVIEYCDVFNTVLETGDHGSFNSWGRDRFWTPDINETAKEVAKNPDLPKLDMLAPNIIRNSRWRCDHGWDIDLDDGSSWYRLYNNVLLNGGLKMREGYDREATNNIIINNSLHPHVWYPGSGDVFKHNIVFGAYKPAVMTRGMAPDAKWGAELDSNLFATNHAHRLKFAVNGCDENSIVGDPLFIDPQKGDYRVKDNSPAFKIGFENFSMDSFGVVSEKLRNKAKQPSMPIFSVAGQETSGKIYRFHGADLKNVETEGEQSAAGLSSAKGIIFLNVPEYSEMAKNGFQTGDVIMRCDDIVINDFEQLDSLIKNNQKNDIPLVIMRNQREKTLILPASPGVVLMERAVDWRGLFEVNGFARRSLHFVRDDMPWMRVFGSTSSG